VDVHHIKSLTSYQLTQFSECAMAPDGPKRHSELRHVRYGIVVCRVVYDSVAVRPKQPRLVGKHRIFAAGPLIEIMDDENFHVVLLRLEAL
jgi:hypothetical protein